MKKLKPDYSILISFIKENPGLSSKQIFDSIHNINSISYATLKRILEVFIKMDYITVIGKGRGTKYQISSAYDIIFDVNPATYFKKEIDEREIKNTFNYNLIKDTLNKISIFSEDELQVLNKLQHNYEEKISKLAEHEYKSELERLAIDLSWKSSQIEGNTYSLLETERLLKEKQTASGKTKDEAVMLLNHKEAIDFIINTPDYIKPLTVRSIEDIHSKLIKELGVDRNIRIRSVGISGTNYRPIDNEFQIREAMEEMCGLINLKQNVFEKALLTLILISYIQPFNDGNKRTARIICNALLINNKYCPISFRTVDSVDYKKAMLIFYEQNNISVFKKIFIAQFEFAVKMYF